MLELSERLGNLKNSARGHKEQMEGAIQVHPNPTLRNAFLMIELLCGFVMEYEATTVNDAVFIQHIQADFKPDEEVIRK
ncbi:MAG: hypothetical protein KAI64_01760, partial [Thermoplasmata archaeon]|nr:hypothetical protein [Thermoplasmata archaeon]